jgi:D-alanine-D-alanine ligase
MGIVNKTNIVVLMGGWSHEHGISIKSGKAVFDNLDSSKYCRRAVIITPESEVKILPPETKPENEALQKTETKNFISAFGELEKWSIDAVVLALHGQGGEDGIIQGFLETLKIPYTHSGVLSSAISMHKIITRQIYKCNNVKIPSGIVLQKSDDLDEVIPKTDFDFPMIVKPPQLGSSFGIKIVENIKQLESSLEELWNIDKQILVEKYIKGKEFTCVVINKKFGEKAEAMPVTEIVPVNSEFFDYEAKYTVGATEEITPARIDSTLAKEIQSIAVKCHEILLCEGISRTDFMLSGEGDLFVLETNTIPGMTETSFVPQVARAVGMSFGELLDIMINYAMEKQITKEESV